MMIWLSFCILGIFTGLASGLFGIGGGVIMVPVLFYSLKVLNFPPDILMLVSTKTSLAVILFTSFYSTFNHHKALPLNFPILKSLALFVIIGTFVGNFLVTLISPETLELLFMIYITVVSLKMWLGFKATKGQSETPLFVNAIVGGIIGLKSAILGIGGGTISIPYLTYRGIKIKEAAGISAGIGVIIALMATSTNLLMGYFQKPELPPYTFGHIYFPGLLGILSTSLLFSKLGVKLAHKIPQEKLRKVFAVLLFILAIKNITGYFELL
ncbi:MAG: sulfite exporter TauE/SafE family protein [Halobacteriovoraceae bacterium]|nr:sulfite exporter TauE/SafE family protein [Halobacteriovoraceae bacterium]